MPFTKGCLAHWCWRRISLNFVNVYLLFPYHLSLEKDGAIYVNKRESPSLTQGCFEPSLVDTDPLVSGIKTIKLCQCIFGIS